MSTRLNVHLPKIGVMPVIQVQGGATQRIDDLYSANTGDIRRHGNSDRAYQYDFFDATVEIRQNSRLIIDASVVFTDSVQLKIEVENGSTLQIGEQQTLFSTEYPSKIRPILVNFRGDQLGNRDGNTVAWIIESAHLVVRNGGRVELLGASLMFQEGNLWFEAGAELFIRDGRFYSDGVREQSFDTPRILFFGGTSSIIDVDGLIATSENGKLQPFTLDQAALPGIRNYQPRHCLFALQFNNGTDGTIVDLASTGNETDIVFNQWLPKTIFARELNGRLLTAETKQRDRHQPWALLQFIDWTFQVFDANGPSSVNVYLRDSNNGEREFAFSSGDHKAFKTFEGTVNQTRTIRLIIAVQDRSLNTNTDTRNGSTRDAPDPAIDDRRPFVGWMRWYGFFQQSLNFNPRLDAAQDYLMVFNRQVTLTQADADAVTGVTITFHGTPVSWNGRNWSVSIEVDGPTLDQAWHYVHSQLTKLTPFAGQISGMSTHNLWPSREQTDSGLYWSDDTLTATRKGVRVITPAEEPFPGVTSMESDDESIYVPPVSVTLSVTDLVADSELVLKRGNDVIFHVESTGTGEVYAYSHTSDRVVDLIINKEGYQFFVRRGITLGSTNQSIRAEQIISSAYATR